MAAGNSYEKASEVWLGDLTGQLMREGTTTRTGAQISKAAAQMGGQVDIGVGTDTASVSGSSLSEFAPDLVKLVADLALAHQSSPRGHVHLVGHAVDLGEFVVGAVREDREPSQRRQQVGLLAHGPQPTSADLRRVEGRA